MATVSRTLSYWAFSATQPGQEVGVATLTYQADDPYAVTINFDPDGTEHPNRWTFARDILADGLTAWSGFGDVVCWTDRVWFYIGLRSSDGQATIKVLAEAVRAFLVDAEDLVPYGSETHSADAELDALLSGGTR